MKKIYDIVVYGIRCKVFLYFLIPLYLLPYTSYAQNCPPNWDFEMGNFTNWSAATAASQGGSWTVGIDTMQHSIQQGNGLDPCGNFPVVCPNGGSYSVRIGSKLNFSPNNDGKASRISYALTVNSSNVNLTFYYAIVMHNFFAITPPEETYWRLTITDSSGSTTALQQYIYSTIQGIGQMSTSCSGATAYLPWTAMNINLSNYLGQQITIAFTVSDDITIGGDDGYSYIDACGLPLATNEIIKQSEILVYPNPTSGIFQITSYGLRITNVEIYNVLGEKVFTSTINPARTTVQSGGHQPSTIDLSNHPSGIYFISIKTEQGTTNKKPILNK